MKQMRLIAILLTGLGLTGPAWGLVVTPARTEVRIVPGTKTQVKLDITNDDPVDVIVDVSKKNWFIPETYKEWTVDKWLTVKGPKSFTLKPGEAQQIKINLECPEAMKGEVVGMVSFLYKADPKAMITPMISVSMYLIAAGHEQISGSIEDLFVRAFDGRLSATVKIKASGNVHIRPQGEITILDKKGAVVARMPVPEGQPAYPGQDSLFGAQTPADVTFAPGSYLLKVNLTYQNLVLNKERPFKVLKNGQVEMGDMS